MEEKLPTMMNAIDPDNKNNSESQTLTESNPEEKRINFFKSFRRKTFPKYKN